MGFQGIRSQNLLERKGMSQDVLIAGKTPRGGLLERGMGGNITKWSVNGSNDDLTKVRGGNRIQTAILSEERSRQGGKRMCGACGHSPPNFLQSI